jgi:hypothetical protein
MPVELSDAEKLARAVLMFHASPTWTDAHRATWKELTGSENATTVTLCDMARKLRSREEAPSTWRPGTGQKIEKLYAWISEEPDGGEGVVGMRIPSLGGMVPLIGADGARIESLRQHAEIVRRVTGYPVRLKVFAQGVVIDEISL